MLDVFPLDAAVHSGFDSESVKDNGVWQGSLIFFSCLHTVFFARLVFVISTIVRMKTFCHLYMRKLGMHLKVNFFLSKK